MGGDFAMMKNSAMELSQPAPLAILGTNARQPWLDVIRGVAVLLVLISHVKPRAPIPGDNLIYQLIFKLHSSGWVGVDLFFVLSGFLVSGILFRQYLKTGEIRAWQFLIRRGLKIYPAFWALIIVTLATMGSLGRSYSLSQILAEFLFFQNYVRGVWTHTWSLAVEEHCYIALCGLLVFLSRRGDRRSNPFSAIPGIVLCIAVAALTMRFLNNPYVPKSFYWKHNFPTHLRCDTFAFGVLLGYLFYFSNGVFLGICERFRSMWLVLGLSCIAPVFFFRFDFDPIVWTWLFSLNAIGGTFIVMSMLGTKRPVRGILKAIAAVGVHSYSIYLWHTLIGIKLLGWTFQRFKIPGHWYVYLPLYFAVCIGAGVLMSYLVERPSLYLRDRFFPELGRSLPPTNLDSVLRFHTDEIVAGMHTRQVSTNLAHTETDLNRT